MQKDGLDLVYYNIYCNKGSKSYLEQTGKLVENVRDNLFSPMALSILSTKYKFHFTYLGTGCIFEYDETHPFGKESNGFNETSLPNLSDLLIRSSRDSQIN